ncbi:MAG: HemK/PrmC family methyltransferase [Pseudomonadota bacterium]
MQHILGEASIYELTLKSDARALIPRQDSAEAISLAIDSLSGMGLLIPAIADLGTGSGVLLAEILHRFENARGFAIERDEKALSLAAENFETLGLSDRTEMFKGSWAEWQSWAKCDLIVSNPPYIRCDVIPTLQTEVRDYDPMAALDGGVDGLDAYREITELAAAQMKPGAYLVFEIGFDQKEAVSQLLLKAGFTDLRHQQDLGGQDRAIAALKS